MEVEVCGLDDKDDDDCLLVRPSAKSGGLLQGKHSIAKLKLVFRGNEPPEGYARIDDQLIKLLP